MKKIPFYCYIGDATTVMIFLFKINCRDRYTLLIKLKHTTTSNIYREGKKNKILLGIDQQNTNSNPLFSTKYFLKDENPIQLFYKKLKKPIK